MLSCALKPSSAKRGAVLVTVLGLIFVISVIVGLFVELQIFKIRESAADYHADDLRVHAYSTLEVTLAMIAEFQAVDSALYSPAQGWKDPLNYMDDFEQPEGVQINVTITDESSRRSLSKMTEPELTQLFEQLDIDLYESQILAQSLLDWTDKDELQRLSGAEKDYYEHENADYEPPNRPLISYEELHYIKGFKEHFFDEEGIPLPRYETLQSLTTLHNIDTVNLNTASGELLSSLNPENNYTAQMLVEQLAGLDGIVGTEDDTFLKSMPEGINLPHTGTTVQMLRIKIEILRGQSSFHLEALAKPTPASPTNTGRARRNTAYPFTFIELRENSNIR